MSEKETFKKEKITELDWLKKRIEELREGMKHMAVEAQELAKKELEILEKKWEEAKTRLSKLGEAKDDAIDTLRENFSNTAEDINQSFKKVVTLFKDKGVPVREDQWAFYQGHADKWRWRLVDPDGHIVGSSHKGYDTKPACIANAVRHGYDGDEK